MQDPTENAIQSRRVLIDQDGTETPVRSNINWCPADDADDIAAAEAADEAAAASKPESRTRVSFDLATVLSRVELDRFLAAAESAEARSVTEHFINLTMRVFPRSAP